MKLLNKYIGLELNSTYLDKVWDDIIETLTTMFEKLGYKRATYHNDNYFYYIDYGYSIKFILGAQSICEIKVKRKRTYLDESNYTYTITGYKIDLFGAETIEERIETIVNAHNENANYRTVEKIYKNSNYKTEEWNLYSVERCKTIYYEIDGSEYESTKYLGKIIFYKEGFANYESPQYNVALSLEDIKYIYKKVIEAEMQSVCNQK